MISDEIENLIIGTGPSALQVARNLTKLGEKFIFVDINNNATSKENIARRPVKQNEFINKTLDLNRNFQLVADDNWSGVLQPSIALGGLSNIWGAAITHKGWDSNNLQNYFENFVYQTSNVSKPKKVINEINHFLALDSTKCTGLGVCNYGCPNNAIWNSKIGVLESGELIITGTVEKIIRNRSLWEVHYRSRDKEIIKAKNVYLCAGALASAIIGMNSDLFPKKGSFTDSTAMFIPILKLTIKSKIQKGKALSQRSFEILKNSELQAQLQYYPNLRNMKNEIIQVTPKFLKPLARNLWKIYSPFFGIGILYFHEKYSRDITIEKRGTEIHIGQGKNSHISQIKKYLYCSNLYFLRYGLMPILPMAKIRPAGDSFHYGKFRVEKLFNLRAKIEDLEKNGLFFMDGFRLHQIPAGPITPAIMEQISEEFPKK